MSVDDYIKRFQECHKEERRFKDIDVKYKKWIENVSSENEKKVLEKIFLNLRFFSKKEMSELLFKKITEIKRDYDDLENTGISPLVPRNGRYSGANELISLIKLKNIEILEDEEENFLPYSDTLLTDIKDVQDFNSLIIVDDIVGTGGTIEKYLRDNVEKFINKTIIFLFILVTDVGLEKIEKLKSEYPNLVIDIRYCYKISKISDLGILSPEEYNILFGIEKRLWNKGEHYVIKEKDYVLGYSGSELLVLFSHNIPNNTVSSFWFEGMNNSWKSLFTRYSAPRKNRKKRQHSQNYEIKKRKKI